MDMLGGEIQLRSKKELIEKCLEKQSYPKQNGATRDVPNGTSPIK
jgi:hypothetical protein